MSMSSAAGGVSATAHLSEHHFLLFEAIVSTLVVHVMRTFASPTPVCAPVCHDAQVVLFCDLHGHSRRFNVFTYGCAPSTLTPVEAMKARVFPLLLTKLAASWAPKPPPAPAPGEVVGSDVAVAVATASAAAAVVVAVAVVAVFAGAQCVPKHGSD
jgi:hypothetical protein